MKLLLIKFGKAWQVLKRDGLWRGGERIAKAFVGLFRSVKPGDVLFISNGVGDSARYRTANVAEELRFQNIRTAITVQDNPFLLSYTEKFSVFVFHRVLYTDRIAQFVTGLKAQGKTIIFETDDLVYDPVFLKHMDYYTKMNAWEKKLYEHGLGGEIVADEAVKVATTTTTFLADKLRERGKHVFVVRNKLSQADVALAERVIGKLVHSDGLIRMTYLSGTPSHNKDFATIAPVLATLLGKYSHLRLVLVGPLDIDELLTPYISQIERVPFLTREELFEHIRQMDINLAPLEIGNPFCESKSELKWFEAGLIAVPTVAAATQTFREAIVDGVDGFVAATPSEWQEKLEHLIVSPEDRQRMGERARQTVLARYTTKYCDEAYNNFLKQCI